MADVGKKLRFAGDVDIERIQITSPNGVYLDIRNQVIAIQLFEDLFSPFITGTIVVQDSLDLLNNIPFLGEEYLSMTISTPTLTKGKIQGEFYIFKMANREISGDRQVIYELHFITQEAVIDMNKRISRAFDGKASDIAKKIITDKDVGLQIPETNIFIEESNNKLKFISNFWTPVRCLTYLCDHAVNKKDSPTFMFFQNRTGFNFISLDTLYNNNDIIELFTYDNFQRDKTASGKDAKNIAEDYKRIRRLAVPVVFDYVDRLSSGMIASKQYSFDIISKNVAITRYDMYKEFDKLNHTNLHPLQSKKVVYKDNVKIINHQRHYDNFTDKGDSSNQKFLQKRVSQMKATDAAKIEITVPGRTQYTVGQKCLVQLNKVQPVKGKEDDEANMDKMLSGAYIIGAINHYIDREKHECVMELFKDSLFRNPDEKK